MATTKVRRELLAMLKVAQRERSNAPKVRRLPISRFLERLTGGRSSKVPLRNVRSMTGSSPSADLLNCKSGSLGSDQPLSGSLAPKFPPDNFAI